MNANELFNQVNINETKIFEQLMKDNIVRGTHKVSAQVEPTTNRNGDDAIKITFFEDGRQLCYTVNTVQYAQNDFRTLLKAWKITPSNFEDLNDALSVAHKLDFYCRETQNGYKFQAFKQHVDLAVEGE